MTLFEILGQAAGFISLGLYLTAYQMKETRKTQLMFVPADLFCGLQYAFLGSMSSCFVLLLAAGRDLAGAVAPDRILRMISLVYVFLVWGMAVFKVHYWQEFLPVAATTLATLAVLSRGHFYKYRLLICGHHVLWMLFNIWIMSLAGIALVFVNASSNIIGAYRYWRRAEAIES